MFPRLGRSSRLAWNPIALGPYRPAISRFSKPIARSFHTPSALHAPKIAPRLRQRIRSATQVVGKPLTPAQRRIRNIGMGALGIATASYVVAVAWDADYPLSMAAIGAFRTTTTFLAGSLCMADYKLLHARYYFTGYDSDEYAAARKVVHARSAQRLLSLCRLHGGIYIKAGQHIASLTFVLPNEFTDTLSVLQDRAPFHSYDEVEKTFYDDFGKRISEVFSMFEERPLAAASIAQVHRARIRETGELVAVKVQHADVSRLFGVDMWTMESLTSLAHELFGSDFELTWIVGEFRKNVETEFDFQNEAKNGQETMNRFQHRKNEFHVPKIYWNLTRERILTMEYIDGVKVNDVERLREIGVDPKWVGRVLQDVFAEMYHPGNMLVYRDPDTNQAKLVLLDHGLYRSIPNNYRLAYCELWRALLSADYNMLQRAAINLNVPRFADMMSIVFTGRLITPTSSSTSTTTSSLSKELSKEERRAAHKELTKGYNVNDIFYFLENVPRELLLIFRVSHMVNSIHRQLGAWKGERFEIYAKYATRGFWCETRDELHMQPTQRTGWKSRWYLFGGAPNLKRSVQYLREVIGMRIRLLIAETALLLIEWWRGGELELDIVDKAVEDKLQMAAH
ncbi:hypothetical protein INT44_003428 [Umbelopsis vinacea]|uniref:ABC1 atypical kinase-like domain-containing protein n=1 Tax=Umbelopsis vinacea TaxID=44442 RepID=A0A8H7PVU5_9FUNG|nr:hypothetical protein INT44_003428 [Umbelopsis vinacea]